MNASRSSVPQSASAGSTTAPTGPNQACAVRALVETGVVPPSRYQSYLAIFAELVALPEDWQ